MNAVMSILLFYDKYSTPLGWRYLFLYVISVSMKLISCFICVLFLSGCASAYIDPGTAGMIVGGSIWPVILAVFVAVTGFFFGFYRQIRDAVFGVFKRLGGK